VRKSRLLSRAAVGALAGIAAGLVTGIGARVAMRMVADGVPDGIMQRPSFTLEGTLAILIFGALLGAPFGVVYEAIADGLPGPPRLHGVLFGALMLATLGAIFLTQVDELFTQGRIVLFACLFPIYGVAVGLALAPSRRIAHGLPAAGQAAFALVALGGALFTAGGIVSLVLQSTGLLPM
jgi:phosphate/sulfate permease